MCRGERHSSSLGVTVPDEAKTVENCNAQDRKTAAKFFAATVKAEDVLLTRR
jgi:hypothetical protein